MSRLHSKTCVFPEGEQDDNPLRAHYEALQAQQGNEALWNMLNEKDPASAKLIHPNNFKRVISTLAGCMKKAFLMLIG